MRNTEEQPREAEAISGSDQPVIDIRDLTKRFGDFTAVDHLSFSVNRAEIFGLLGPNGSGKTTTINMVSGLARPTAGAITVLGHDVVRQPLAVHRQLGVVPQETALYEELSAEANLRFHGDLFDVPRRELDRRMVELLDLVQLGERRRDRVSTFSGGMKRRLALARALLPNPDLLYLDEPTLGVDVQSRHAIWDHIRGLKERGKTVLVTTNYLEEANVLCDRLAIMDRGRLVALDTPANLKHRFGDTVLAVSTDPPASAALLAEISQLPGVTDVIESDGGFKVTMESERTVAGRVLNLITRETEIRAVNQREPSLDEVFLSLTGREVRD